MKLHVGLIGLGNAWENRHRAALRMLADRFEVRAICDQVGDRAKMAVADFDATVVDGFHALIAREDLDAVLLLAPQWFGSLPILAACRAGKAVYLGTGVDFDGETAANVRLRVEASGIAFMAEFPRRLSPATLRMKELIATRLGRPQLIFCHQRLPLLESNNHCPRSRPPHTLRQELIELVDWCRYVVDDEPSSVTGLIHHSDEAETFEEDYRMMSLDFSDADRPGTGTVAQISCGRYVPGRWSEAVTYRPIAAMQVSCERGIAFLDLPSTLIWFDEAGRHQEPLESERPVGEQLLRQFYRVVTSLVSKPTSLDDAYRALQIVEQGFQSHAVGRRLKVE